MFKFLDRNTPAMLFVLPIIVFAIWARGYNISFNYSFTFEQSPGVLYNLLNLREINKTALLLLGFLFVLLHVFLITRLNSRFVLVENRNYLPAILYIIFTGTLNQIKYFNPILISNTFLIIAFWNLLSSYKKDKAFDSIFNIGFWIAVGSLFYSGLIYILPTFILGLFVLRTFNWREYFILLLGFSSPVFIIFSYLYLLDMPYLDTLNQFMEYFNLKQDFSFLTLGNITYFSLFILLVLVSMFHLFTGDSIKKIATRKYFIVLTWFLFNCIIAALVEKTILIEAYYIASIPVCFIISKYLMNTRYRIYQEVFTILLIAISIFVMI